MSCWSAGHPEAGVGQRGVSGSMCAGENVPGAGPRFDPHSGAGHFTGKATYWCGSPADPHDIPKPNYNGPNKGALIGLPNRSHTLGLIGLL